MTTLLGLKPVKKKRSRDCNLLHILDLQIIEQNKDPAVVRYALKYLVGLFSICCSSMAMYTSK